MVNTARSVRRRLSVEDRREELVQVGVELIATQPWDLVTMADIAASAGVSKPLLYHYFSTKRDLYLAAVRASAEELRMATSPDVDVPADQRVQHALRAHIDWVERNESRYRAVLHGGLSADPDVHAIVETSRTEVVARIAQRMGHRRPPPRLRIALRGWVGFLEGACLDWLVSKDISKQQLVQLLTASLTAAISENG